MNLAGIFGNNSIQGTQEISTAAGMRDILGSNENTARAAQLIRDLIPGQTIQAQVLALDGENATLKLANNALIQAALGKNASGLDVGKLMSFEVRGNGQMLSLSPLFTNTATDPTVQKALTMAGLPVNNSSAQMTGALMQAGMPIDRSTLTGIYNEIVSHTEADVLDIVDLHRLNLPVNDENLQQLSSYKNLSYQLADGMKDVANQMQGLLTDLAGTDPKAGMSILDTVLQTYVAGLSQEAEGEEGNLQGFPPEGEKAAAATENTGKEAPVTATMPEIGSKEIAEPQSRAVAASNAQSAGNAGNAAQRALELLARLNDPAATQKPAEGQNAPQNTIQNLPETVNREEIFRELGALLEKETGTSLPKDATPQQILTQSAQVFHEALTGGKPELAQRLLSSKEFVRGVFEGLKDQWTIKPEDVARKENVEKLFTRLHSQLHDISRAMEENAQTRTPAFQAVNNMSSNVDFLQQVNQMYAYVQLPIRLSQGDTAHGDLYVYTNGRRLSQNDGHVSALLHLDMEHLGPVDVYVSMDTSGSDSRVSTQFYLPDDDTLDFLNQHMDELTDRLQKRGYNCSAKLTVRGQEEPGVEPIPAASGINMLLVQKSSFGGAEKSFDVRT